MIAAQLARYETPACENCGTFCPDVMVPIADERTAALCWVCAHAVTVHESTLGAPVTDCGCSHDEVYPPDVVRRRKAQAPIAGEFDTSDVEDRTQKPSEYAERPEFVGRDSTRWQAMREAAREVFSRPALDAGGPFVVQNRRAYPEHDRRFAMSAKLVTK